MRMTFAPKNSGESFFSRYDSRNDLGYGRNSNKFHKPRSLSGNYPYQEESDYDSDTDWEDEESRTAIDSKSPSHKKSDPFSKKSTNPFYFVAGNTKLSDCFSRPDDVLAEIHAMANSLVPFPAMNKNRTNFSGGSRVASSAISGQTGKLRGSKKGFSSSPPEIKYDKIVNDEDEVIFNLEDLVKKIAVETGSFRS